MSSDAIPWSVSDQGSGAQLAVRVNDELTLDAGTCEMLPARGGRVIRPPSTSLFNQVLAYLREKPAPSRQSRMSWARREGIATTALILRWGSYLAVLLDHDKPVWSEAGSPEASRITDQEMARINIEASAALANWIDLFRAERGGKSYEQLVNRAVAYLPMPKGRSLPDSIVGLEAFADPAVASSLLGLLSGSPSGIEEVRRTVESHPTRVLANAFVNTAWRNGPVERIHAGKDRGSPLDLRRMTPGEESELMAFASQRLAQGMSTCSRFTLEQPPRSWPDQVLPYTVVPMLWPSSWTVTEESREVLLDA